MLDNHDESEKKVLGKTCVSCTSCASELRLRHEPKTLAGDCSRANSCVFAVRTQMGISLDPFLLVELQQRSYGES